MFYSTKFASDKWMQQLGYMEPENKPSWWDLPLSTLNLSKQTTGNSQTTCSQAVEAMNAEKMNQLAVVDAEGWVSNDDKWCDGKLYNHFNSCCS